MTALLGSLLGFLGSFLPDMLKLWQDRIDRHHELAVMRLQMQHAADGHAARLEEIHAQADIAESRAIYKTFQSGIDWVDALNGTVRPVLAYAFFLLYCLVKCSQIALAMEQSLPGFLLVQLLWAEEDQAIFAGIISFYFGQRAMQKVRQGK